MKTVHPSKAVVTRNHPSEQNGRFRPHLKKVILLLCIFFLHAAPSLKAAQAFTYTVENNEVTITGCHGIVTDLKIPAMIEGLPVTIIGKEAFYQKRGLTSVEMPDSVHTIEFQAFGSNYQLTNVRLPKGLKSIGGHAFSYCSNLKKIQLPEGLEQIGLGAFSHCGFPTIMIPATVTKIEMDSRFGPPFEGCRDLGAIDVAPQNTQYASRDGVFYSKDFQELIKYPEGKRGNYTVSSEMYKIHTRALAGVSQLSNILVGEGNLAFSASDGVLLSQDGQTLIQYPAGKSGRVVIPESVTRLADYSFFGCEKLVEINLPDRVTAVGRGAFQSCFSLQKIRFPQGLEVLESDLFMNSMKINNIFLPDSIVRIERSAIFYLPDLTEIKLPASLLSLGDSNLTQCSSLKRIEIPANTEEIGNYAFSGCKMLREVLIPPSVRRIGANAFSECPTLRKVILRNSNIEIGKNAFPNTAVEYAAIEPSEITKPADAVKPDSLDSATTVSSAVAASSTPSPTPQQPKIPAFLTLSKAVQIPLVREGKPIGSVSLPAGTKLKTLGEKGDQITVIHPTLGPFTQRRDAFTEYAKVAKTASTPTLSKGLDGDATTSSSPKSVVDSTPSSVKQSAESPFRINVAGKEVSIKRLGSGPVGVILFGHSGSREMVQYIEKNADWLGDLFQKCTIFLWEYPQAKPFDQVKATLEAYQRDSSAKLSFAGIASSVISQIREKSGLKEFLIIGNSLGAGIILQDYSALVEDKNLSYLLISPTECFMPPVEAIKPIERTDILAAKGLNSGPNFIRTDRFLKGENAWNWVAKNRTTEWCDLIAQGGAADRVMVRLNESSVETRGPTDFSAGHFTIGGEINAELLAKLIRVKLGFADKSVLAERPQQKNATDALPMGGKPGPLSGKQTSVTIHLLTRDGLRALRDENGKKRDWNGKAGEGLWIIPVGTRLEIVKAVPASGEMEKALVQYTKDGVTEQFWTEAPWFQEGPTPRNYVDRFMEFDEPGRGTFLRTEIRSTGKTYHMIDVYPLLYASPKGYFELADGTQSQLHIGTAYHPDYLANGKILCYEKTEPLLQRTKELKEVPDFNQTMKFVVVPKPTPFTEKEVDALLLKLRETGLEKSGYPTVEIPVNLNKQTHRPGESPWTASLWVEAKEPLVDRSKPVRAVSVDENQDRRH